MSKVKIIAFCGAKGAGKSTAATLLRELVPNKIEELALAGHLKNVCSKVFNLNLDLFLNPALKERELEDLVVLTPETLAAVLGQFYVEGNLEQHIRPHIGRVLDTPRSLLQYIGTEVLHPIDPLIHVKIMARNVSEDKLTVLTDLRFFNEFNYFKETMGDAFLPVYIKNNAAELVALADQHPSERDLEKFKSKCEVIENHGSMAEFRTKLSTLLVQGIA